jgi:hypothetical protein
MTLPTVTASGLPTVAPAGTVYVVTRESKSTPVAAATLHVSHCRYVKWSSPTTDAVYGRTVTKTCGDCKRFLGAAAR